MHGLLVLLCLQLSLIAAAATTSGVTYSRGDKNAYLTARGHRDDPPHYNYKLLRKQQLKEPSAEQQLYNYDDPQACTIYIAQSSIPNSGLGMYTTISYPKLAPIGHSEVGVVIHDISKHYPDSDSAKDLFKNYVWGSSNVAYGKFEATASSVMMFGVGMMANDFPVLTNIQQNEHSHKTKFWKDGTDTLAIEGVKHTTVEDIGRGSSSSHSGIAFHAIKPVEAGDELFVSYGSGWFKAREKVIGVVPEQEHYKMAYDTIKQFMTRAKQDELDINNDAVALQQRYEERIIKADWIKDRSRLKAALPDNVSDIPAMLSMGAAAFSMKDNARSVEWIEENGSCVDAIAAGISTIPQAGIGAFAKRNIQKDSTVITTPSITLTLNQLKLRKSVTGADGQQYVIHGGFQMLLNYCYGHHESTLVFLPSAPTVNFINHGGKDKANAEIRWSSSPHHQADWLNLSFEEITAKMKSGLLFDIVATKDIKRGDEILLNYGNDWDDTWDYHIEHSDSNNFTEMLGVATSADYNQQEDSVVRTVVEQKTQPYPEHIATLCSFFPPESCKSPPNENSLNGVKCIVQSNHTGPVLSLHRCEIISREVAANGVNWYTANVTVTKEGSKKIEDITEYYLVKYLHRYAIRFVDLPYTKDQYKDGAFRHPIGISDGLMPEQWLNLRLKANT